jgi:hypothetical protein
MQVLLTQQEYINLQLKQDDKFNNLKHILNDIATEDDKLKLDLFNKLVKDLNFAEKSGIIDAILFSWTHRKESKN